jgi:hypothetical protein
MKFIKVTATSNPENNPDDKSTATFYLNCDMIKIISLDGSIYLKIKDGDSNDKTLWNENIEFTNIKIHQDSMDWFRNNLH